MISRKALKKAYDNLELPLRISATHEADKSGVLSVLGLSKIGTIDKVQFENNKIQIQEITIHDERVHKELLNNNLGNLSCNITIQDYKEAEKDELTIVKDLAITSLSLVDYGACPNCKINIDTSAESASIGLEHNAIVYKKLNIMEDKPMSEEINDSILQDELSKSRQQVKELKASLEQKEQEFKAYLKKDRSEELKEFTSQARKEIQAELKAESHIDTLIAQGVVLGKDKEIHLAAAIRDGLDEYKKLMAGVARAVPLGKQSGNPHHTIGAEATSINAQKAVELEKWKISLEMGNIKEKDVPESILAKIKGE
jgi:hypothetical protein